ncbi:hypothetical protein SD37_16900 [Amycolatopsis orientalis]|uniref:TfoX N-terminal domain-containing protein n=1 Tax=Amycolatopsis orientalis TaxID=31958 RepID=A0A193BYA8_AMYOR|nr:TfoX/Sxy family protein [Amycolatopsis orientalis]ANN17155.1 hypothetical protein SD37_16900 [Amycolatopsis orientalis]
MKAHNPHELLARLNEIAAGLPFEVTTRPMMGGFIGYADGKVFVSISSGGLGVKLLPADQERALARPGATRMRHSADQPYSKTYITLSDKDIADDDVLTEWLLLAAKTAPAPKPRKKS